MLGCLALLIVPLPASVVAPVVIEPRGARTVYVEVEGRLTWAIPTGAQVKAGDPVARLENLPLKSELTKLTGDRDVKQQELTNLLRRQSDPEAAARIPAAEKSLADVTRRLCQRQRDFERLVICTPCGGVVLPPPPEADDPTAPGWAGTPLDPENLGCHLQTGDVVCIVGAPRSMDALAYIAQGNEDRIQTGQEVQLLVDAMPNVGLVGEVELPPTTRARQAPEELIARGELPLERDQHGQPRPNQPIFVASIALSPLEQPLVIGATGRAKIVVAPRSILSRMWRMIAQTVRAP